MEEYFEYPYSIFGIKIRDYNGRCFLDFINDKKEPDYLDENASIRNIVIACLNKEVKGFSKNIWSENNIIYWSGHPILLVRGWGYLTGIGGLHLSATEATNVINNITNDIVSRLLLP